MSTQDGIVALVCMTVIACVILAVEVSALPFW